MKITLERLREIITEEVIKEELAPEIAAPAIAAMLQGMEPDATSDVFGDAFNQMYGEGALDAEAERQASAEEPKPEMRQPIGFDREPEEASMREPARMGFKENINEIIRQEYYIYLIESHQRLLKEAPYISPQARAQSAAAMDRQRKNQDAVKRARRNIAMKDPKLTPRWSSVGPLKHPKTRKPMPAKEWAELILSMGEPERGAPEFQSSIYFRDPESESGYGRKPNPKYIKTRPYETARSDWVMAKEIEAAGFPPAPEEFFGAKDPTQLGHPAVSLPRTMTQWNETSLNDLVDIWEKYIKGGGNIRKAVEDTQIEGEKITDALAALYKKLTADANIQQHTQ